MLYCKRLLLLTVSILLINGCSKLDDYMLGKDNTPQPKELKPVNSKIVMKETWSSPIGSGKKSDPHLKLKPVLAGGFLYNADSTGLIQSIDKKSGKQNWAVKLPYTLVSGPAVSNGRLIVTTDDANLVALKQSDGSEIWKSKLSGEVLAIPVVAQNKVIAKTIDGNLYALNLDTGERLWVSEHGAPSLILKASSSPVLLGNLVLVGYSDGKMDAVDLESGRVLWQRSIAYASGSSDVERLVDIDADPIVEGTTALLGSYQGYVGALSLENGQFIWKKPASIFQNMVVKGNNLYLTDSNDVVWSFNKTNGQVNWKQVALKARGLTEPVLIGNRLYIGDKTGMLHVLSTKSGEFLARDPMNGPINVAPIVSGNSLFVVTANGKLSRYNVS